MTKNVSKAEAMTIAVNAVNDDIVPPEMMARVPCLWHRLLNPGDVIEQQHGSSLDAGTPLSSVELNRELKPLIVDEDTRINKSRGIVFHAEFDGSPIFDAMGNEQSKWLHVGDKLTFEFDRNCLRKSTTVPGGEYLVNPCEGMPYDAIVTDGTVAVWDEDATVVYIAEDKHHASFTACRIDKYDQLKFAAKRGDVAVLITGYVDAMTAEVFRGGKGVQSCRWNDWCDDVSAVVLLNGDVLVRFRSNVRLFTAADYTGGQYFLVCTNATRIGATSAGGAWIERGDDVIFVFEPEGGDYRTVRNVRRVLEWPFVEVRHEDGTTRIATCFEGTLHDEWIGKGNVEGFCKDAGEGFFAAVGQGFELSLVTRGRCLATGKWRTIDLDQALMIGGRAIFPARSIEAPNSWVVIDGRTNKQIGEPGDRVHGLRIEQGVLRWITRRDHAFIACTAGI